VAPNRDQKDISVSSLCSFDYLAFIYKITFNDSMIEPDHSEHGHKNRAPIKRS
jgi:hypothetical protein